MDFEPEGNGSAIHMKRWPSILLLALALAGFWLSGMQHSRLLDLRRAHRLDHADPLENAPPLIAFTTVALGGFRGIIADVLWVRSSTLQEQGKFFELVQLADWITKLEPRFPEVWAFHAWNLAYNISVLFNSPEDRWRWVRSGISLLRDEGLRYNPAEAQLYRELGWLFQHKIGADYDQAHTHYKQQWAMEMMQLFNGPGPDYARLLPDPADEDSREFALRLRRNYRLDPAAMQEVDERYGPLDWRLPQAHAIYWASHGKRYAEGFEDLALSRMIFQSIADAFRRGRLFMTTSGDVFIPSPNLDLLPRVLEVFKAAMAEFPEAESIRQAYPNFLVEAILTLYTFNRTRDARDLFEELSRDYPSEFTADGFDAFIYRTFTAAMDEPAPREAVGLIEGAAYQAAYWAALGDTERAAGYDRLAQLIWTRYMANRTDPDFLERTSMPPLDQIRRKAAEDAAAALQ